MATPGDKSTCEYNVLVAGGYGGANKQSIPDMELAWLQNNGATSKNLSDAWIQFLATHGFTTGNRSTDERAYYLSLAMPVEGGANATLSDLRREFWCGGHNPP